MYDPLFIGIDIGSSFIKLSLIDSKQQVLKSMRFPSNEMKIKSEELGWAEQEPEIWWKLV
jgi:xylulokinase